MDSEIKPHMPSPDEIEVIVIDLDGTLLNSEHIMTDRTHDTIRRAIDAGKKIVLATGKTRASAESVIAALNLSTPGVFNQGTVIFNADGGIRSRQVIDSQVARRVIQFAENNGMDVLAYCGNRLVAKHADEPFDILEDYHEPKVEALGNLVNKLDMLHINKLIVFSSSPRKLKALRWQLNQQVGDSISFTRTAVSDQLEVLPKNASKGNGVRALLNEMSVDPATVMALGDADNDVEMLKIVGLGIAMENASDALKAVAKVTTKSNDEDGVAEAIERYALGEEPGEKAASEEAETEAAPESTTEATKETTSAETPAMDAETNTNAESSE